MKPKITVQGKIQKAVVKKVVTKKTNFLLTINLNKSYKNDDPHFANDVQIFDELMNDILSNIDQYINLPNTDSWNDDLIKSVNVDYVIEKGLQKRNLHTHCLISIEHFTNIKLDYSKIKNKIKDELGLPNIYINNRLIKNNGNQNVLEYIDKYA
jgi:hypothetical protein